MSRYIDADALQTQLERKKAGVANQRYTEGWNDCMMRVKSMVSKEPTIYAVPVVYGYWETNSDRLDSLICSVCKCGFDMRKHDPHNFCPNCGAKNGWRLLRGVR